MLSPLEMSDTLQLKAFVIERLTAAAEEIFGVFENVIKYYDEDSRSTRDIERQNRILDLVLKPDVKIQRADPPHSVCKDEVPHEQQERERSHSLGQEDPEPPQIKEEQEENWTSQEGEQLQWLEEADTKDSTFTISSVRNLHDQHQSQSPHLNQTVENREGEPLPSTSTEQMETEADGEGCGISEPTTDTLSLDCFIAESDDTDRDEDWTERGGPPSGFKTKTLQTVKRVLVSNSGISSNDRKSMELSHCPIPYCSVCHKGFPSIREFDLHMKAHAGEKPYTCSVCGEGFRAVGNTKAHVGVHTGVKPYSCGACERKFRENSKLALLKTHAGVKPCSCGICERKFWAKSTLTDHMNTHTGQRPHRCTVCGKGFSKVANMKAHMTIHTGEKPYSCSVCERRFRENGKLTRHMKTHTGEKPYSCSVCGKGFSQVGNMRVHMRTHTVEQGHMVS